MPQALSDSAFGDAIGFMDQALLAFESLETQDFGVVLFFEKEKSAKNFRMRCYTARTRELRINKKVYKEDTENIFYRETIYHPIQFIIKKVSHKGRDCWALYAVIGERVIELIGLGMERVGPGDLERTEWGTEEKASEKEEIKVEVASPKPINDPLVDKIQSEGLSFGKEKDSKENS